jgi:hypothetical protein
VNDIDIDKLEALERVATPAPWLCDDGIEQDEHTQHRARRESVGPFGADAARTDDCIFLAELRNTAPALLAEVRRLRAIEAAAIGLMVPYESRCSQRNQWVCFLPSGQRVLLTIDSVAALQAALAAKEGGK